MEVSVLGAVLPLQPLHVSTINPHQLWHRFFPPKPSGQRRSAGGRSPFELLPADVLVDEIMSRLDIKSLVSLRKVNKTFYMMSREPAIWKRFLPHIHTLPHPLPSVPPTAKYTIKHLAARDIESVVTRAITVDNNWRSKQPTPFKVKRYESYHRILSMVLLPGSHYMVASVVDRIGKYAIMIWAMDHPAFFDGGPIPLAIRHTEVKAYNLQAKYLSVNGKKGIAIAFLRKRHKERGDTRDIPETLEMGADAEPEDPWMPLKYECTVLHVSLDSVDALTDRRLRPESFEFEEVARAQKDAFEIVARIRTGTQLGIMGLDEIYGRSSVTVLKRPNTIILQDLGSEMRTTLLCPPSQFYPQTRHAIWNYKVLPMQGQVFTIRHLERAPGKLLTTFILEMWPLPQPGTEAIGAPFEVFQLAHPGVVNVQLSDLPTNISDDESAGPQLHRNRSPPPLSIYLRQVPQGFIHLSMWPVAVHLPPSPPDTPEHDGGGHGGRAAARNRAKAIIPQNNVVRFWYHLTSIRYQRTMKYPIRAQVGDLRILPGASRAFLYSIYPHAVRSIAPPVLSMSTYVSPEFGSELSQGRIDLTDDHNQRQAAMHVETVDENPKQLASGMMIPLWPGARKQLRQRSVAGVYLAPAFVDRVKSGLSAIAWDETVGKVCVATLKDGQLYVMDFAYKSDEDDVDRYFFDLADKPLAIDTQMPHEEEEEQESVCYEDEDDDMLMSPRNAIEVE